MVGRARIVARLIFRTWGSMIGTCCRAIRSGGERSRARSRFPRSQCTRKWEGTLSVRFQSAQVTASESLPDPPSTLQAPSGLGLNSNLQFTKDRRRLGRKARETAQLDTPSNGMHSHGAPARALHTRSGRQRQFRRWRNCAASGAGLLARRDAARLGWPRSGRTCRTDSAPLAAEHGCSWQHARS